MSNCTQTVYADACPVKDEIEERRAGMKTKGPSEFTKEDKIKFCEEFEKILSNKEGI